MTSEQFINRAKEITKDYVLEDLNKGQDVPNFEVAVVWFGYVLGSQKALITTDIKDGMYYEVTYNASENEIYFDAYKRWKNIKYDV